MKKMYNKLVRDKMLEIYKHDVANEISAKDFKVRWLTPQETLEELKNKLLEEAQEVFEAYGKEDMSPLKEEIADLIEVIDAILYHNGLKLDEVLAIRDTKKAKKGGFETGLFLESIDYFDEKI
jgi:predicted house-cleaning noncanonical NTP pyrophosphatase (MazG superfamily)